MIIPILWISLSLIWLLTSWEACEVPCYLTDVPLWLQRVVLDMRMSNYTYCNPYNSKQNKLVLVQAFHNNLIRSAAKGSSTPCTMKTMVCIILLYLPCFYSYCSCLIPDEIWDPVGILFINFIQGQSYWMVIDFYHFKHKCCLMDWNVFKNLAANMWAFCFTQQYILKQISQLFGVLHIGFDS